MQFLQILWNPDKALFHIGSFGLRYYSLTWVLAFVLGLVLMTRIFKRENKPLQKLDSLFIYTILGTILGARLGHVFFYDWAYYKNHLLEILLPFRFENGFEFTGYSGLASHGAAIGIIAGMYLFIRKNKEFTFSWILDRIVIPVALGGIFIRIGNFFNSEIVGKQCADNLFSGVKFLQHDIEPYKAAQITGNRNSSIAYDLIASKAEYADTLSSIPYRYPVQLYEATGYLITFIILYLLYWKTDVRNKPWFIFGLFLILLWGIRFVMEYFKESQGGFESALNMGLSTGQLLSIPFILVGFYLIFRPKKA